MRTLLHTLIALLLCTALSAQSYQDLIRENPERAAGVRHSYEYRPAAETRVPRGYKPFYVSHYGRHGSRRATSSTAEKSFEYLSKAHELGILTSEGEELYRMVWAIHEDHVEMVGELTERGGREHRAIAERMYRHFPSVWRSRRRTRVHVQSSNSPRCLLSMANFTSSLDDMAPRLVFDFITGDKVLNLLSHDYYDGRTILKAARAVKDSMEKATVNPRRFIESIFRGDPLQVAPDSLTLMHQVYAFGGMRQCTETPDADIYRRFFTVDELIALYRCSNARSYMIMGNSEEYGDHVIWAARGLVQDIIDRADEALQSGSTTAADLRFGHDTGIMPLAGLIGLEVTGDRFRADAVTEEGWQCFEQLCMGSNLQMVFYRRRGREPLVKFYYNERETKIKGLDGGPYYKWSELRAYLLRRIAETEI